MGAPGDRASRRERKHGKKHGKKHSKKHKKSSKKHHRRACSDSGSGSSSSSSSSDGSGDSLRHRSGGSALSQLARERAAVQGARFILSSQPGMRKGLRELLWELDNGRAVGLAGVADELLRSQLQFLLELLGLKLTKGQYWLPSGAPSTLSVLGFVFEEPQQQQRLLPPPGMPMPTPVPLEEEEVAAVAPGAGAAAVAGPVAVVPADDADDATAGVPECTTHAGDDNGEGCAGRVGAVGAGPAAAGPASSPPPLQQAGPAPCPPDAGGGSVAAPGRRVAGPAAPPPELLAAAAAFHAEVEAAGGYGPAPDQLDDDGDDVEGLGPLAGPPPPDLLEEAEAAPADAREAAVLRVLRVLRAAAAAAAGAGGAGGGAAAAAAAAAALAADPYELLGVERGTDAGACRKAYWRLSLLVHPDKCVHPGAAEAFQAVSKAATLLQDAGARAAHDAAVEDAALRRRAEADAAAAMRAAEWARARGGAVPPEVAAALAAAQAAAGGPPTREDWMTQLPTGRSAASALAGLSQVSQTSFSRFGGRGRGDDDTSGWTDTPQQAAQRAAGLLTGGGGALALAAPPRRGAGEDAPVPEELRAAMAQYQAAHRQTSLLEQHQARQQQPQSARPAAPLRKEQQSGDKDKDRGKSKDKDKDRDKSKHKEKSRSKDRDGGRSKDKQGTKRAAEGPSAKVADWADKHPWQPWDRDKDLSVPVSKPKGTAELLKSAGALSSRFASGR